MRRKRGRLYKSMQENITIERQPVLGGDPVPLPGVLWPVPVVIAPDRLVSQLEDALEIENRYRCNIIPPIPDVRPTDRVVRHDVTTAHGKILTVTEERTVRDMQQLVLTNREQPTV